MTTYSLLPQYRTRLEQLLISEEGYRQFPYADQFGNETIGYGRALKIKGISPTEALFLLRNDIAETELALWQAIPWYDKLDDPRKIVLIDMAFELGAHGLLEFKGMLAALEHGQYAEAADAMLASLWAKQVPTRAEKLALIMRSGQI